MAKKLYIETQGCQMNEYDSSRMADLLGESHGLELTTNPEDADVLLLNTCSIREKAQEKVFSELGRWRSVLPPGSAPVFSFISALRVTFCRNTWPVLAWYGYPRESGVQ